MGSKLTGARDEDGRVDMMTVAEVMMLVVLVVVVGVGMAAEDMGRVDMTILMDLLVLFAQSPHKKHGLLPPCF